MRWPIALIAALTFFAILIGPFLISENNIAQALFGIITTIISTSVGVWASWNYSKNSDKERLTRYGLLAWRNIDALSIKVRQQIQHGNVKEETLESWLLDIDEAKWAWRDLLREVFELQERLTLEREEVSLEYKKKISEATNDKEREKLEGERRLAVAKIVNQAPLPISEEENISCPNCGNSVVVSLGSNPGSTSWPECGGCGALFPVHRKAEGEIIINQEGMKLSVSRKCPDCQTNLSWRIPTNKSVHFLYKCSNCNAPIQCDGTASDFAVSVPHNENG